MFVRRSLVKGGMGGCVVDFIPDTVYIDDSVRSMILLYGDDDHFFAELLPPGGGRGTLAEPSENRFCSWMIFDDLRNKTCASLLRK